MLQIRIRWKHYKPRFEPLSVGVQDWNQEVKREKVHVFSCGSHGLLSSSTPRLVQVTTPRANLGLSYSGRLD
ncbi:hypothetical protein Moror_2776 [Moniliophthora roreri MCA 2997]|uniref:Uncharacterized protein n=1 Tax=Moniliophthora roreri (strain MCA 2997) TaxID=1381753 RepID=V2YI24_MONRO|nr:hypothetical protein Moror_2776 [Moniliophthora roreri MCA 2997]